MCRRLWSESKSHCPIREAETQRAAAEPPPPCRTAGVSGGLGAAVKRSPCGPRSIDALSPFAPSFSFRPCFTTLNVQTINRCPTEHAAFSHAGRANCELVGGKVSHRTDYGLSGNQGLPGASLGGPGTSGPWNSGLWEPLFPQDSASARIGEKRDGDAKGTRCLSHATLSRCTRRLQTLKPLKGEFKLGSCTDGTQRHTG